MKGVRENVVVLRPSGFVEFEAVFQGHKTTLYILNGPYYQAGID